MKAITRFFHTSDFARGLILFLALIVATQLDNWFPLGEDLAYLSTVLTTTSLLLVVAGVSHLLRRVLFPYLDLSVFVKNAEEDTMAGALVFLGVCIILSVFVLSNVLLLN